MSIERVRRKLLDAVLDELRQQPDVATQDDSVYLQPGERAPRPRDPRLATDPTYAGPHPGLTRPPRQLDE